MPPSIKKQFYQVVFRIYRAEHLPKMDTFGTIDAFVRLDYLGKKLKTEVITQKKSEKDVMWDQELWIPVQLPIVSDRIVMKVYDYDTASDDIVASMVFHLKDFIERG